MIRLVLTTGGTGGHIFPALAVAEAVKRLEPTAEVLFVGGGGPERELATKAGLPFVGLPAKGVFGRGIRALAAPFVWPGPLAWRPGCSGGPNPRWWPASAAMPASSPWPRPGFWAFPPTSTSINSRPGRVTNRLLGRFVDRIFITYPDRDHGLSPGSDHPARESDPARNRRRHGASRRRPAPLADSRRQPGRPGHKRCRPGRPAPAAGCRPSRSVSRSGGPISSAWAGWRPGCCTTGPRLGEEPELVIENFIEDMADAYAWSDLVLARAGATTLAEVTAAGKPAILIPFPFATHDHQAVNAAFLGESGAAVVIAQEALPGHDLAGEIDNLLSDPERLAAMGAAASAQAMPRAAHAIAARPARPGSRKGRREMIEPLSSPPRIPRAMQRPKSKRST